MSWNLPPGVSERDLPGDDRDEEVVEIAAMCEDCEWQGLAEVFEGEFVPCQCGADGLVRL